MQSHRNVQFLNEYLDATEALTSETGARMARLAETTATSFTAQYNLMEELDSTLEEIRTTSASGLRARVHRLAELVAEYKAAAEMKAVLAVEMECMVSERTEYLRVFGETGVPPDAGPGLWGDLRPDDGAEDTVEDASDGENSQRSQQLPPSSSTSTFAAKSLKRTITIPKTVKPRVVLSETTSNSHPRFAASSSSSSMSGRRPSMTEMEAAKALKAAAGRAKDAAVSRKRKPQPVEHSSPRRRKRPPVATRGFNTSIYCFCKEDLGPDVPMIECNAGSDCPAGSWFHFQCAGVSKVPKGIWKCQACRDS
ncbi:uncharacterized protein EV422DRAFT_416985 [Fimicolochytrium jonesii]|uniref:uncharacterized protein n=1 Tax=Fimicolochytrium jonesii TaxID=1396493 RepID=UPI0022FDDD30|nr:uncharacterized protein EV422DRAFT_416985 [Fimicolochytrium jonesii]KAI8822102.1 hypothetical protein EV422DRAFT_416985 [Fimicolochytrium jonesii]